ncbi:MAG: 23S rRNA (adenine(2503)-C(2))-methyltransferase RlmN [Armatimonadetes bacterium]|nr:23S rRNA (adenine(2503)-C(2))-methyltransferase RlmN [Armatimonadota bacterium]
MSSPAVQESFSCHLLDGKVNLKDLLPEELERFFGLLGEPRFRAGQVIRWMYVRGVSDFGHMTDLAKELRGRLQEIAVVPNLEADVQQLSEAQDTSKYLFRLPDGNAVESVRMRYLENLGPGRVAVCISSQVGCAMACDFCASGLLGLKRNLKTWEIVDQVTQIQNRVRDRGERVANVVFMGLGEPLHNYDNLLRAIRLINLQEGLAIGMRHLTVSTAGLVPQITKLAQEKLSLCLAISLHATDDELRGKMMPINRRWPIEQLLEACREYQRLTDRRVTFEYLMIDGVNDSLEQARRLGSMVSGLHALINLIPWNPVEGIPYRRSTRAAVRAFQAEVEKYGVKCTVRQEKGSDIEAACGQLRLRDLGERALPAQRAG